MFKLNSKELKMVVVLVVLVDLLGFTLPPASAEVAEEVVIPNIPTIMIGEDGAMSVEDLMGPYCCWSFCLEWRKAYFCEASYFGCMALAVITCGTLSGGNPYAFAACMAAAAVTCSITSYYPAYCVGGWVTHCYTDCPN